MTELFPCSSRCTSITEIWTTRESHGKSPQESNRVIESFCNRSHGLKLERTYLREEAENLITVFKYMKDY